MDIFPQALKIYSTDPPESPGVSPESDYRSRVNLALSLLNHRQPTADTCDLAVLALQGATVEDLHQAGRW